MTLETASQSTKQERRAESMEGAFRKIGGKPGSVTVMEAQGFQKEEVDSTEG